MNRANESFEFEKNGLDKVKNVSYEKFQMSLDKMDELAGYYAMEYSLNYDIKLMPLKDIAYEGKKEEDNYYDMLHKQNTVEEYCHALKKILWKMPLDDITKGYEELTKNPEEDLIKIMHKVFGSNFENKLLDNQKNKDDEEQDQNLSEAKEEDDQSHRYKKGKLYLAVLYNERINKTNGKNDAYIILFDEKEQYKKGMELLQRCGLSRIIGREEDEVYFKAVRMEKETGLKKVPIAIFKDNTFYSEKYKRTFMHAWKGDIVLVKVIGKNENGMLVTERYAEE